MTLRSRLVRTSSAAALALAAACATQTAAPPTSAPVVISAPAPAPAPAPVPGARRTHELLDATLWTQTAVEHDALCLQAYRVVMEQAEKALRDPKWTAAEEQTGSYESLPPAVIFDADETLIDNSAFNVEMIRDGITYDAAKWRAWSTGGMATALAGAPEMTRFLKEKGIEIFVVTNREASLKAATVKNLVEIGLAIRPDGSTVLMRGERPEWTGDKGSRRAFVAQSHRVLLLVGDDLGDFLSGVDASIDERRAMVAKRPGVWGTKWVMLPNPMYGSWERATYPRGVTDENERLRHKYEKLKGFLK